MRVVEVLCSSDKGEAESRRNRPCKWILLNLCIAIAILYAGVCLLNNARPDECDRIDWDGDPLHWCLGSCYQPVKLQSIEDIVASGKETELVDTLTGDQVICKLHAVQVALVTLDGGERKLFGQHRNTGSILLQINFAGMYTLPGGGIRVNERVIDGLWREIKEELGLDRTDYATRLNYDLTYSDPKREFYCGHLFHIQLSRDELIQSIHAGIRGSDMGVEVMGYSLIPTYIDLGSNGFPAFLSQAINPSSSTSMIGNSLQQILFLFTQATNPSILSRNHLITGLKKACELASGKNVPKDHGKSLDNWED